MSSNDENMMAGEGTAEINKGIKRAAPEANSTHDSSGGLDSNSNKAAADGTTVSAKESSMASCSPPPAKMSRPNNPADGSPGAEKAQITTTDSARVEAEALRAVGLTVGDRLEVMWVLENEEEGKSTEKWWGCSVAGAVTGKRGESGDPVFTLHYDAFQSFPEDDHEVTFTDKFRLIHLEDGAEMTWKKEGEEVDEAALMASLADVDIDLQEVVAAQEQEDAEAGEESAESRGMKELAQLPFHQQSALAEGFRRMTDVVKGHLRAKMEKQGGGEVVVSAADVENMFRDVRAGAGAGGGGSSYGV